MGLTGILVPREGVHCTLGWGGSGAGDLGMLSPEKDFQKSGVCKTRATSNQAERIVKGICGLYF